MLFLVDGEEMNLEQARDFLENYDYEEEYFDELLDECYEDVEICGYSWNASTAFKELDPIAYDCAMLEWVDGRVSDILYEMGRMEDGETTYVFGIGIECIGEEEEEEEED